MPKIQTEKEATISKKAKQIHNAFCNYQIVKANKPSRIYTVREPERKQSGIRTSGLSRAMLAQQLASLF